MSKLTKIERIRLSVEDVEKLNNLNRFGINKSKFVRQAIRDKIEKEIPTLLAKEKRMKNLIKIPF